jgi:hypothetical protein
MLAFWYFYTNTPDAIKEELQNIIRGELEEGQVDSCPTIRNFLCRSFGTGPAIKREFESRTVIKENHSVDDAKGKIGALLTLKAEDELKIKL